MVELIKVDNEVFEQVKKASTRPKKHNLQWLIERFMCSEDKIAEVKWDDGHYKNCASAHSAFGKAVRFSGYRLKIVQSNNRLFMVKEDINE